MGGFGRGCVLSRVFLDCGGVGWNRNLVQWSQFTSGVIDNSSHFTHAELKLQTVCKVSLQETQWAFLMRDSLTRQTEV